MLSRRALHFLKTINPKALYPGAALLLLALYLLPLLIYGGALNILVFDNLDSNVVWYKILAESGKIFAPNSAIISNMMGGLPRAAFGTEFDALLWLYYFLTPIHAYIANELIMHLVAFASMYLFLDRIVFKDEGAQKVIYVSAGALYFALLPFWPSGGLSVPLMPLVTYALIKIEQKEASWRCWLILVLMPFYSSFILVYFFYFLLATLYLIRQTVVYGRFSKPLFLAIALAVTLFLLKEYRLVLQMFFESGFVSNRSEYYSLVNKSFIESYKSALLHFLDGVPHAKGVHLQLILPASLFALLLSLAPQKLSLRETALFGVLVLASYLTPFWDILLKQRYTLLLLGAIFILFLFRKKERLLPAMLLFLLLISLWFGFAFYEGWQSVFEHFAGLKMFNFSRFFFVAQMGWGVVAALVFRVFLQKLRLGEMVVLAAMVAQFYLSANAAFFGKKVDLYHLPFSRFYAQAQFEQIRDFIGKPQQSYRVVSLGIDPAVSLFNGFCTLDGYMVNYPLAYKHAFRKIIARFLEQSPFHKDLFDGWGSKVYLYDHGVQYAYLTTLDARGSRVGAYGALELNVSQIAHMGGNYLLSAKKIKDAQKYGLVALKRFSDDVSLWQVTLYEIKGVDSE